MNKCIMLGNITRDAERVSNDMVKTTIAVNDKRGGDTLFIECVFFGKTGEILEKYTNKGSKILIEGKLRLSTWERDGEKRQKYSITVNNLTLMPSNNNNNNNNNIETY